MRWFKVIRNIGGLSIIRWSEKLHHNQSARFLPRKIDQHKFGWTYIVCNTWNGQLDTIYTDLKSAFDSTSKNWASWCNRKIRLMVALIYITVFSTWGYQATSGVPQGSNLGPLLFSIFFNDFCLVLPDGTRLLYADDLKIFLRIRSIQDCKELQRLINVFQGWCSRNLLLVSISKCSVISFSRRKFEVTQCLENHWNEHLWWKTWECCSTQSSRSRIITRRSYQKQTET